MCRRFITSSSCSSTSQSPVQTNRQSSTDLPDNSNDNNSNDNHSNDNNNNNNNNSNNNHSNDNDNDNMRKTR